MLTGYRTTAVIKASLIPRAPKKQRPGAKEEKKKGGQDTSA
jgi:hypothetical protein